MQSEDDRLAKLAEKLHGVRDNLPGVDGEAPTMPKSDIRVSRNSGNVNFGTQVNIGNSMSTEPMASSQRRSLNDRVEELAGAYGVDPRVVWREVLHTRFGVSSIGELSKAQYIEAAQALDAYEVQLKGQVADSKEQHHVKRLVAEALQIAHSRDAYQTMIRFCSREFGETALNSLSADQLKQVLKFLEESTIAQDRSAGGRSTESKPPRHSGDSFVSGLISLGSQYPMHCGTVAVVLIILGKII